MRLITILFLVFTMFMPIALAEEQEPKTPDEGQTQTEEWQPTMALHMLVRCDTMDNVSKALANEWGEQPFATGNGMIVLSANGMAVPTTLVLTLNVEKGTYTINAVLPNKNACMLMSGNNFALASRPSKKIKIHLKPEYIVENNLSKIEAN